MNNFFLSFLITFIAGSSTLLGSLIVFINKDENKVIYKCLMISSSIMIWTSLNDLLPSSYNYISNIYSVLPSILLIVIYMFFGFVITRVFSSKKRNDDSLYKLGIISMIAIILHNIPEGIITFVSSSKDLSLGVSLSIAILLHNIPEGIGVAVPIYYSTRSKKKAFLYTALAGFSETIGAIISYIFIDSINDYLFAVILSFTAGIMIYLSIFEFIKESRKYEKNIELIKYFFIGTIFILIIKKLMP